MLKYIIGITFVPLLEKPANIIHKYS